jgi:hypothetical protein
VGGISDGALYPERPQVPHGTPGKLERNTRAVSELPEDFPWEQEAWRFCVTREIAMPLLRGGSRQLPHVT